MNKTVNPMQFDVVRYRRDFPILSQTVYGKPLVYLDNAATTQKPKAVIDTLTRYYSEENSNIHRGVFCLSEKATMMYESARNKIAQFLHAESTREIIFTRGTTEGINLVAQSYARHFLKKGDEILITEMEHHANIVPWQLVCEQIGARLVVAPISDDGDLDLEAFKQRLSGKPKIVAIGHVSNALGTVNPVKSIVQWAKQAGAVTLIDGAQAVAHQAVDVRDLGCDYYAFSGHKLFGPTGIGVLYGREALLEKMPPYQGGGDMISSVTFEKTTYNTLPYKFEAGTPHIAGVIGLGAAIDYLQSIGLSSIECYEKALLQYAHKKIKEVKGLNIIGNAKEKAGVISFVLGSAHAHDIGTILDREGIAVRAGHHCAMPVMTRFKIPATARASIAFYNLESEIDALVLALNRVMEIFK